MFLKAQLAQSERQYRKFDKSDECFHRFEAKIKVLGVLKLQRNDQITKNGISFPLPSVLLLQAGSKVRDRPQTPKGQTPPNFKETEIEIAFHLSISLDPNITHLPSSDLTNTGCSKENILSQVVSLPAS